jgi:hypothetical protein
MNSLGTGDGAGIAAALRRAPNGPAVEKRESYQRIVARACAIPGGEAALAAKLDDGGHGNGEHAPQQKAERPAGDGKRARHDICHRSRSSRHDIRTSKNSTRRRCPTARLHPLSASALRDHGMELVPGRQQERFDTTLPVKLERGGGIARNVSATGIYFVTGQTLKEGARVTFALDFQDFSGGPIQVNCIARVVRIEKQDGKKKGVAAAIRSFEFHRLPSRKKTP